MPKKPTTPTSGKKVTASGSAVEREVQRLLGDAYSTVVGLAAGLGDIYADADSVSLTETNWASLTANGRHGAKIGRAHV